MEYIDEHSAATQAPRAVVWQSLLGTLRTAMNERFARVLGCEPARATDEFDGTVGQTLPGFRVVAATPARRLVLEGHHRFARYRLTFELDGGRVRARTDAAFPGVRGRLYRAAVIGTGGHRLVTRRIVRQVAAARS